MLFTSNIMRGLKRLPLFKKMEQVLHRLYIALGVFIAVCIVLFLSILITGVYFLVHLIQGR